MERFATDGLDAMLSFLIDEQLPVDQSALSESEVMKFAEYAEARIEHYWFVDLDERVTPTAYRLVGDAYEKIGELTGIAMPELDGVRITLDLDALTTAKVQRL